MKKSIIISIQPQWVEKILNGEKTIEIHKSIPKCEFPIDVYIYCCKSKELHLDYELHNNKKRWFNWNKKSHHYPFKYCKDEFGEEMGESFNGKIIAKFTLNKVDKINNCGSCFEIANESYAYTNAIGNRSCLDFNDMKKYLNDKNGYAWHIDNLEIFDKPMELSVFYKNNYDEDNAKPCNCGKSCKYEGYDLQEHQNICEIDYDGASCPFIKVQKVPQSWFYAYKEE